MTNLGTELKKQRHHFADKSPYSQGYSLSSIHVQMWELDRKEGRVLKNWCFWTMVLEKTPESPLDSKEIKPVNPKGNNPEYLLEGLMLKLEAPIFDHLMWTADSGERPWSWEKLKAEEGDRGWDGWMASLIQWTWTWANSGRWWGTGRPSLLQSMQLQTIGHDLVTEKQQASNSRKLPGILGTMVEFT